MTLNQRPIGLLLRLNWSRGHFSTLNALEWRYIIALIACQAKLDSTRRLKVLFFLFNSFLINAILLIMSSSTAFDVPKRHATRLHNTNSACVVWSTLRALTLIRFNGFVLLITHSRATLEVVFRRHSSIALHSCHLVLSQHHGKYMPSGSRTAAGGFLPMLPSSLTDIFFFPSVTKQTF